MNDLPCVHAAAGVPCPGHPMPRPPRRYMGARLSDDAVEVTVDGRSLPLRLELRNHSPTGFEWGYLGSGPAQLALAIVCDVLGVPTGAREPRLFDDHADPRVVRALAVYQHFKDDHVAKWPDRWWILDEDVMRCIERVEQERADARSPMDA